MHVTALKAAVIFFFGRDGTELYSPEARAHLGRGARGGPVPLWQAGPCLIPHPGQRTGLFCSPLFAKHGGPGVWKISCLPTPLLPAPLLPSLPVESLGGDCSQWGRGGCTGVRRDFSPSLPQSSSQQTEAFLELSGAMHGSGGCPTSSPGSVGL